MSGWASGDLEVGGTRLHYHRTGGDGPPLVMLHGFSDAGICWTRTARDLEGDYDIVMPDARGHGGSDRAGGRRDGSTLAADAAGLIEGLSFDRVALMGHSMGAATAAGVAVSRPDLVACLVLEDPPWRDQAQAVPGRWDYIRHCQELPLGEAPAYCHELHPTWDDAEVGPWVEAKRQFDLSLLDAVPAEARPWRETVATIRCPTLLLTAENDRGAIVTPEAALEMTGLGPVRVVHIEGAGHNIRREQYERYRAAVTTFLGEVYAPAREGTRDGTR